ncbi:ATP-dependent RNA helicase RhlE [compost metagenome]
MEAFNSIKKELKTYTEKKLREAKKKHFQVLELLESAYCFIGDEAHHSSSATWYDTLMLCKNAVYRIGLTGTVDKEDVTNYMRLMGCTGDILTKISNEFLIEQGFSAKPTIHLATIKQPSLPGNLTWQQAYKAGVVENEFRNELIAEQVLDRYSKGDGCLVIVNHLAHGELLEKLFEDRGIEYEFTHGSFDGRERVLADMKTGKLKVLIATSILDEGIDISGINSLWLASGGKSYRQVLQRIGRGLRKKADGSGLTVYDFLDYTQVHLTKHTAKRYQYYKDENFEVKRI